MNRKVLSFVVFCVALIMVLTGVNSSQAFQIQSPNIPEIDLGQPGLSFRYVEEFGVVETPYIEDGDHLNDPASVTVDSNGNIWVSEWQGMRTSKFNSTGVYQFSLGQAGFRGGDEEILGPVGDTAVDSNGNIWVSEGYDHRVVKYNSAGIYLSELGQKWNSGSDNDHFDGPRGLAFDSNGNLYVSDRNNHRIQIFDSSGIYTTTLGETGVTGSDNSHFSRPTNIRIDSANRLYVADTDNHRVQIFNVSDPQAISFVATLGVSGVSGSDNAHFNRPYGVAVDSSKIYVADINNNRLQIFNAITYAYLATIGTGVGGSSNTEFLWPSNVDVDGNGNIYVSEFGNHRVQKFNSSYAYVSTMGMNGIPYLTTTYYYNSPNGLAATSDGSLIVAEHGGQRVIKINPGGSQVWAAGEAGVRGDDEQHFSQPIGVAVDGNGQVYVTEQRNNRIHILNADGTHNSFFGTYGSNNYQFNGPHGITFDSSGRLYVADTWNHRIQIFDGNLNYLDTVGVTGISGNDNTHFNAPQGIAVDSSGMIYVADTDNDRIQVFDSNHIYQNTIGSSNNPCDDSFESFCGPFDLAVDAQSRLYVADAWHNRVQVFDSNGAYLTTIGGHWGGDLGEIRAIHGVVVDANGYVYISDYDNHRIHKYVPGVPNWKQVNINGFGKRHNTAAVNMEIFNNQLYVSTGSWSGGGAEIWRTADGTTWEQANETGFGASNVDANAAAIDFEIFNNQLYVSTGWGGEPGQIWRSSDGLVWVQVEDNGFDDPGNGGINIFGVFNNQLYVTTQGNDGVEIWRSSNGNAGTWVRVVENGGSDNMSFITDLAEFKGKFYAMVENNEDPRTGCQVWETSDGTTWTAVVDDGFGDTENYQTGGAVVFNDWLYVSTRNDTTGGEIWRTDNGTDWENAANGGFGNVDNVKIENVFVFQDFLFATANNYATGLQVWRSTDGTTWEPIVTDGFGDPKSSSTIWTGLEFQGSLFMSADNNGSGTKIWQMLNNIYLPLVIR